MGDINHGRISSRRTQEGSCKSFGLACPNGTRHAAEHGACHNSQICATARQAIDHSVHCWTHRAACCCCCCSSGWHETRHRAETVPVQMPKIKYKLLPRRRRRRRCATQRCVCKIVERIKKSRMHATTMDNVAQGENQCNSRQQSRFSDVCLPMPMLMPLFFRRIVLLPLSCCCRATLTAVQAATGRRLPCPSPCLAFSSLPFPCSVVAKCNHCNRFCTISNALGPQDAAPLALPRILGVAAARRRRRSRHR